MAQILYIEDHEVFAQGVMQQFLQHHQVVRVETLAQAREAWQQQRSFDLVLLDYDLPDGKGADFVDWLRQQDHPVPVLAVSSHEHGNQQLMDAGATAVCSKMSISQLPRHLEALLGAP